MGTRETSLPPEIGQLHNLRFLDLRDSQIQSLPPEIGTLTRLEGINANGGSLRRLPEEIGNLKRLRQLDVHGCPLVEIPEALWECSSLEQLALGGQYRQLPPGIHKLKNLRRLDIDATCRLDWLPRGFAALPMLTLLTMPPAADGSLPLQVFHLPRLEHLTVVGGRYVRLPAEVGQLARLRELNLGTAIVTDLPTELADLPQLDTLRLQPEHLAEPLGDLYSRGLPALLAYLRDEGRDGVPLYEIKVLLVGEGEVGKSSLVGAFHRHPFVVGRPTTHGIELSNVELPHPSESDVVITFRIWDFGGQEVYRITHQFFFSRRSLYLLVWKPRQGQDENSIEFWLRLIRLRVGRDARVMIVATHGDERQPEIDIPYLRAKFAPSLIGQWVVDNASGTGLPDIERELAHEASRYPQMGRRLSKRWIAVRDELASLNHPQIPYRSYHDICVKHNVDAEAERTLIELLHDLGNVVYFSEIDGLRDIIVLQPEWLTRAIGYVLEDMSTRAAGGVLDHGRLRDIWQSADPDREQYPAEHHPYFLRLMEKFDVSYRLPDSDKSLVAQLVPYERPVLRWQSNLVRSSKVNEVSLVCELSDDVPGLIAWLTVRNYRFSTGLHWRRGVFLRHDSYNLEALIELVDDKRLYLTVRGPSPVYFFSILRDAVEDLLRTRWPGLRYNLLVPCPNAPGGAQCAGTFPLSALDGLFQSGRDAVTCHTCLRDMALTLLLTGFPGEYESASSALARQDRLFEEMVQEISGMTATVHQIESIASDTALMLHRVRRMLSTEVADCPALISISQTTGSRFNPARLFRHRFVLNLWCEHPEHQHRCRHPGYRFSRSREWFLRAEPYLLRLSKVLRLIPLTGAVAGLLGALDPARTAEMTRLKAETDLMGAVASLFPTGAGESGLAVGFSDEVGGFRAVRELLFDLDPARDFAGLRRVVSESGDFLWVCPDHYSVYDPGLPEL
ncbi:COR domain-containing protein [Micromonospora sp. WMMD998]|uniref:COR domain-containing protein n=1 Tax=Micromonospora sp. WMMD998 TaxID=3016092 RepID=UPI00249B5D12|nr:COR domain-containing protein [Micromonospora sp. WMMD998]WFE40262.1 COR domain-containing protein [Micromonospora sp. WMMD998]